MRGWPAPLFCVSVGVVVVAVVVGAVVVTVVVACRRCRSGCRVEGGREAARVPGAQEAAAGERDRDSAMEGDGFHGLTVGTGSAATAMGKSPMGAKTAGSGCEQALRARTAATDAANARGRYAPVADGREDDVTGQPVPTPPRSRLDRHHRFPLSGSWFSPTPACLSLSLLHGFFRNLSPACCLWIAQHTRVISASVPRCSQGRI